MAIEEIQVDPPQSTVPAIPPWGPTVSSRLEDPQFRIGSGATDPLPQRGFPVQRAFTEPFDFEFRSSVAPPPLVEETPLILVAGTAANKVRVIDGLVNGLHPTIGGTELNADPPPEITVSTTSTVWLKCVGVFGSPDTYTVTVQTSSGASTTTPPTASVISGTGFTSYQPLGYVYFDAGAITSIEKIYRGGHMGVVSHGSANLWFNY